MSRSRLKERVHRIDDDARQARRVEHALLEVEVPGAVLLGEQPALQAVGEAGDRARQVAQLLVEERAKALQLVGLDRSSAATSSSKARVNTA